MNKFLIFLFIKHFYLAFQNCPYVNHQADSGSCRRYAVKQLRTQLNQLRDWFLYRTVQAVQPLVQAVQAIVQAVQAVQAVQDWCLYWSLYMGVTFPLPTPHTQHMLQTTQVQADGTAGAETFKLTPVHEFDCPRNKQSASVAQTTTTHGANNDVVIEMSQISH